VRWLICSGLFVGLALAASATQATAIANDNGATGSGGSVGNAIFAGVQYGTPPSGKSSKDTSGCVWVPAGEAATVEGTLVDTKVVKGTTYHLFIRACPTSNQGVWVPTVTTRNLALNAAAKVKELLAPPSFGSAPPAANGVVNVGMWSWTSPAEFTRHSITAWVPTPTGIAWTTTTATPVSLVLKSGEPGSAPMVCQGPGTPWNPAFGDEAVSECMYTYRHSSEISPSGMFDAQLSIVWKIAWTSNVGGGATLPDVVTTTHQAMIIGEIQAVVTS